EQAGPDEDPRRRLRAPRGNGRTGARPHAERCNHDDGHARHRVRRNRPLRRTRASTGHPDPMNAVPETRRLLSEKSYARIDRELKKFPSERKRSVVIAALAIAQDEIGWVSKEVIEDIATYLDLPPVAIYEVASFYTLFNTKP